MAVVIGKPLDALRLPLDRQATFNTGMKIPLWGICEL